MSFGLPTKRTAVEGQGIRWSGAAVLVEALLLLVFLLASLAVLTQMFATAVNRADDSARLTAAVAAASDVAERFAADPTQAGGEEMTDDLLVVCDVTAEPRRAGTLYHATISVYAAGDAGAAAGVAGASAAGADADASPTGEPLYVITTSRYESGVGR